VEVEGGGRREEGGGRREEGGGGGTKWRFGWLTLLLFSLSSLESFFSSWSPDVRPHQVRPSDLHRRRGNQDFTSDP